MVCGGSGMSGVDGGEGGSGVAIGNGGSISSCTSSACSAAGGKQSAMSISPATRYAHYRLLLLSKHQTLCMKKCRPSCPRAPFQSFGPYNLTPAGAPLGEARTFFSSVATRGGRVAAFATFKKDTTLERQGRFTLSTLQGGARAGES